jgi:hypothetical protein
MAKFNPKDHMTNLKGKEYLEVKWRLVWLREDKPAACIDTELTHITDSVIIMRARISVGGQVIATGYGTAPLAGQGSWRGREVEKAETAAIGRALAHAGYGTQFTGEDEEDYLADSSVQRKPKQNNDKLQRQPDDLIGKGAWWTRMQNDREVTDLYSHESHLINAIKKVATDDGIDMDTVPYSKIKRILIDRKALQTGEVAS